MADSDKNILITPNKGSTTDLPKIEFTGADPNTITLSVLDDATLSFSGTSGQLFSISDSLTGTIFSVNDVSGIPSIEVDDDGTVRLAEFAGNLLVGTDVDAGDHKVQIKSDVSDHPLLIESAFSDKIKLKNTNTSIGGNGVDFYNSDDKMTGSLRTSWSSSFKYTELYQSFDTNAAQVRRLRLKPGENLKAVYGSTEYDIWHSGIFANNSANWNTAYSWGNHASAGYLTSLPSHNHTIANVTGLQAALNGKVDDSQVLTNVPSGAVFTDTNTWRPIHDSPVNGATTTSISSNWAFDNVKTAVPTGAVFTDTVYSHPSSHPATMITTTDQFAYSNSSNVQDVLDDLDQAIANVNAKDPVLTLTGDVTGTATFTNLGNATLTATVANDSHTHDGRYYTESESNSLFMNTKRSAYDSNTFGTYIISKDDGGFTGTKPSGSHNGVGVISLHTHSGNYYSQLHLDTNQNQLWMRSANNTGSYGGFAEIWASNNDGSGSGLDADLLDGQQGSYYAPASSIGNGTVTITTSGSASGGGSFTLNQSGNTTINISATDTNTTYNFSGSAFQSRNSGNVIAIDSATTNMSGYVNSSSAAGYADGGAWVAAYSSSWVAQIFQNFRNGEITTRGKNSGTWQSWRKQWDSSNDGSGSGLDADLLDGLHASSFWQNSGSWRGIHTDKTRVYGVSYGGGEVWLGYTGGKGYVIADGEFYANEGNSRVFHDTYHPNADKWTTARSHTVTLTGDVTGSATQSVDGTGNRTWTVSTAVANNSHSHNNYLNKYSELSSGDLNTFTANESGVYFGNSGYSGVSNIPYANYFTMLHLRNPYSDVNSGSNSLDRAAQLWFGDTPGRAYWRPYQGSTTGWHGWETIWTSANDGSGSGLDADLLDGLQLHTGRNNEANKVVRTDGNGYLNAGWINTTSGSTTGTSRIYASNDSYIRYVTNDTFRNNLGLWWTGNDGSGSGLDADLLDGQHGSYYDHRAYTSTSNYLGAHYVSGGSEKPNSSALGAGKLKPIMLSGSNIGVSGAWNDVLWMSTYTGGDVKRSTAIISSKYDNTSVWVNKANYDSSSWGTSYLFWNTGNDGSGSGLDADLLDGVHGSSFLRSDVADYINGNIYLRADITNETAYRDHGVYGFYDSTKINHIWSMGVNYRVPANGSSFGNLYGLAYKHTNNSTGGTMGGGHQMVWCQNGTPYAALGSNIWTSGNVTAYSDRRVKTNLELIPNALEKVQQLNGYTFDRTDVNYDEEGEPLSPIRQTGVVAQEVLEVLPEAVTGSEGEHYSVAYGNMVGLLIEAIKEQQIQIEDLSSELKSLKENN